MSPLENFYSRRCRTPKCWMELNERKIVGPGLVCKTKEKFKIIVNHLKAAQDRQELYVDLKRKEIYFQVGDKLLLKVSPQK